MCNIWTNEHVFLWTDGTSRPTIPTWVTCQCGRFRFDGMPTLATFEVRISNSGVYGEIETYPAIAGDGS